MSNYTSLRKGLSIIRALKGRSIKGATNKEIASATNLHPVDVSRIVKALIDEGFATRDGNQFSLSVQMLQISEAHRLEVSNALDRIHELDQRVKIGANT